MNNQGLIHIFVSSTFNDMQSERDAIMKFVVPRLNDVLAQYGKRVIVLDLRWGVDTHDNNEEDSEKKVLHLCFKAIRECRPYFIGLIGARYGWVPDRNRMHSILNNLDEGDRELVSSLGDNKSVTEMEIMLGAIGHPDMLSHSIFCFRDDASYSGMNKCNELKYIDRANVSDASRMSSARKLSSLKERITKACENSTESSLINYCPQWDQVQERFVGLDEFVDTLTKTLLDDILKDISSNDSTPLTEYEQQRHTQQVFVDRLASEFIGRHRIIDNIIKFVDDFYKGEQGLFTHHGIIIEDVSGSGKSSVYAVLCKKLESLGFTPLFYSAGLSLQSEWDSKMIKYFLNLLGTDKEYPIAQDVSAAITELLVKGLKPVMLIDSLDNITNVRLSEIRKLIPASVPFVATTTPGIIGLKVEIDDHIYNTLHLGDYTKSEAHELLDFIMCRNYKELSDDLIDKLLQKKSADGITPAYTMPIWLKMAANILLELGDQDFCAIHGISGMAEDLRIQTYLTSVIESLPSTVEDLFRYTIDIACRYFDPEVTLQSLLYIAMSHSGLSEETLAQLIGDKWNGLEFKSMRYWMHLYIRENAQGRYQLTHQLFKKVVMGTDDLQMQKCKDRFNEFLIAQIDSEGRLEQSIADFIVSTGNVELLNRICYERYSDMPILGLVDYYNREPEEFLEFTRQFASTYMESITYWLPSVASDSTYGLLSMEALKKSNALYDVALSTYTHQDVTCDDLQLLKDYFSLMSNKLDTYREHNIEDEDYWTAIDEFTNVFMENKSTRPDDLVTIDLTYDVLPILAQKAKHLMRATKYDLKIYPVMMDSLDKFIADCQWYFSGFKDQDIAPLRYNRPHLLFSFVFLRNNPLEVDDYIRVGKLIHELAYDFASIADEEYKAKVDDMFISMTKEYTRNLSKDTFEHTVITKLFPEIVADIIGNS